MFKFILVILVVGLSLVAEQLKFVETIGIGPWYYENGALEIIKTSDDGYAIAGRTNSYGAGGYDLILSRFNKIGKHLWTRIIGGPGEESPLNYDALSLVETKDSGLVIAGVTNSFGAGDYDILLAKFDASGNFLWAKTIGGASGDDTRHIIQTDDGGLIMTGYTWSFAYRRSDIFVVKLDSLSNLSWATSIHWEYWDECGNAIVQTQDNGYVVAGGSWSFGSNHMCPVLTKLDSAGNWVWSTQIDIGGGVNVNSANTILEDPDGNLFIAGITEEFSSGGAADCFLSKFDASGTYLWTRSWGGTNKEEASHMVMTPDGRIVITGYTESYGAGSKDIFLSKFDTAGNHLWSRTIGGIYSDYGYSVTLAGDSGLTIAGYAVGFGPDSIDMILVKCDSLGMTCIGDTVTPVVGSPSPNNGSDAPYITNSTPTVMDITPEVAVVTPDINFICKESSPPIPFNLISPPDSTEFAIARPTFVWESSFALSGLANYEVYIRDTLRATTLDTFWTSDYNLSEEFNDWYVIAYDNFDNPRKSNQTWTVIVDTSGPFIDSTTIWKDSTTYKGPYPIYTKVTGLNQINKVKLCYKRRGDPGWFFKDMTPGEKNWYYEEIPGVLEYNDTVKYYIYAVDNLPDEATDPKKAPSNYYSFIVVEPSGVEENETPGKFSLSVNSPAKDKLLFRFSLPEKARISLVVRDVIGRTVWGVKSFEYPEGVHEIPFVPKRKGIYFYEFNSPFKVMKGKLVIL
ncbi:MAG: hypothetical protein ABIN61_00985 [candidate division WOR-3 bacterium]